MIGFVYIWFDRKHRMYYIGSHKGKQEDNYICSNRRMKYAYKKRQNDFKRRVVYEGINFREIEQSLLDKIQIQEFGTRYYNLKGLAFGGNGGANKGQKRTEEFKQRISVIKKMQGIRITVSPEGIERIRQSKLGVPRSEATKAKLRAAFLGKKRGPYKPRVKYGG